MKIYKIQTIPTRRNRKRITLDAEFPTIEAAIEWGNKNFRPYWKQLHTIIEIDTEKVNYLEEVQEKSKGSQIPTETK